MRTGGEVVILGGGVIGLTAAYFLAREGVRVRVLDKGQIGREASWAGAGILPPSDWLSAREPIDRLRALSCQLYPGLSEQLLESTGVNNGYIRCGGLQFLRQNSVLPDQEWAGEGAPEEMLNDSDVSRLEPAVVTGFRTNGFNRARLLPTLAQLRNPHHLRALRVACENSGKVTFAEGVEALEVTIRKGRVTGISTSIGNVEADVFLIATGAWVDKLLGSCGLQTGVRPIRGQMVLLNAAKVYFTRVLILEQEYMVPRRDGRVLIGSTEEDVGFVKQTTADSINGLLNRALWRVPDLNSAQFEQCWSGLRPGTPDGLPFIGRAPGIDNLFVATGHFRAGIQLSPGTAVLLKEMILGQPLTMPVEAFRLERIARAD